jgi:16S rRNA (guanine527-N7)-methyltransferase
LRPEPWGIEEQRRSKSVSASWKKTLIEGSRKLGIPLSDDQAEQFGLFLEDLKEWNKKLNLTSLSQDEDIVVLHFLDSLTVHPHLPTGLPLLDLGSGAGLPGIPLKIVDLTRPVTLVESSKKKVLFQEHIIRRLGLNGIESLWARGERLGETSGVKSLADLLVSRALSLKDVLRSGSPLVKSGGALIVMKGPNFKDELDASRALMEESNLGMERIVPVKLPFFGHKRNLLVMRKL